MFGHLTNKMAEQLGSVVQGRTVWDLGAGYLGYSSRLLDLGAHKVIAVEKEDLDVAVPKGVELRRNYFTDVAPEPIEVAFLSWPQNNRLWGLIGLLERAERVVYLGSNTSGSACGPRDLWDHLTFRTIEAYIPTQRNTFIVYGSPSGRRALRGEELGATSGISMPFDVAEKIANEVQEVVEKS